MLFSADEIKDYQKPKNDVASLVAIQDNEEFLLFKQNDTLREILPLIRKDVSYHFATGGLWSTHELLFHLLAFTGPAKVYMATWSITEDPARMLVNGLNSGVITELFAVLDIRVKQRSPKTYAFAKHNFCKARVSICHAKVTVIQNDHWDIAIVGSANYTNNPRIEAGVISVNQKTANCHKDWILAELENAHPFDL